jgi:replication initiator protein RepSA
VADTVTLHRVSPGEATTPRPGPHPTLTTPTRVLDCQPRFDTMSTVAIGPWVNPGPVGSAAQWALHRAATTPDYHRWLDHVRPAAGCTRPIRLAGYVATIDTDGRLVAQTSTEDMPDGVIYKPCGNRRATLCPSCAETYRWDAYQLIRAGLAGGKGVPDSVARHPAVFATFTAPSFGPVHTRVVRTHTCQGRRRCDCRAEPCHPRRPTTVAARCGHGQLPVCWARHEDGDERLGRPLCPDCYDYHHQAVWNHHAAELWRRTTITITRQLRRLARARGIDPKCVRVAFGKVAEMQRRAAVHYHAIIRLDGVDPTDPTAITPPPPGLHVEDLVDAITHAARTVFHTDPHPAGRQGWAIGWGTQLDLRAIGASGEVSDTAVAGYLAKYATKSTEATGHLSVRLSDDTIEQHADPDGDHTARLINACWTLGTPKAWRGLRRWAHMLGFGGHFLTKSARYSTTFQLLRQQRTTWQRTHTTESSTSPVVDTEPIDPPTTVVVGLLSFAGAGWHTTGDALLANTAAALARERQAAARDQLTLAA